MKLFFKIPKRVPWHLMNFYIKSTKKCLVAPYCLKSARTLSKNKITFQLAYIETNGGYFSFHIA